MLYCDRCGKKINHIINSETYKLRDIRVYDTQTDFLDYYVELCDDCDNELEKFIEQAKSYFMVNKENPFDIFNGVKYWGKVRQ